MATISRKKVGIVPTIEVALVVVLVDTNFSVVDAYHVN